MTYGDTTLLVDTSSLLRAGLDRFDARHWDRRDHGVIEALVLFPTVLLDGPSVRRAMGALRWLDELGGDVHVLELSSQNVHELYDRGGCLVDAIEKSADNVRLLGGHFPQNLGVEFGRAWNPSTYWRDLPRRLPPEFQALRVRMEDAFGDARPYSATAFVALVRLFYYLALQEQTGSVLLLEAKKSFGIELPEFGRARTILDVFDVDVRAAYGRRHTKWLGAAPRWLDMPLIAAYVADTADRKGWSLGRVIAWMREWPELQQFRAGMRGLMQGIETEDHIALDQIFSDLDLGLQQWAQRLGSGIPRKKLPLTVPLPLPLQPTIDIPLNLPFRRRPGEKMLVLIERLLSATV